MSQYPYRSSIDTVALPFTSRYCGRTIIQPQLDQYQQANISGGITDITANKGIPEVFYIHDVLPTRQGIKSVAYQKVLKGLPNVNTFDRIQSVRDSANNIGFLGTTTDGRSFLLSTFLTTWVEVTPAGAPSTSEISVANVTGQSYVCYPKFGIYTVDLVSGTLTTAAISWGATVNDAGNTVNSSMIISITDCYNFLLATDGYTLYNSSATNPLDFDVSQGLITGATSQVPTDIQGPIIVLVKIGIGFGIFTNTNIVSGQWSNNIQYPWVLRSVPNSGGIDSISKITKGGPDGTVYAYTSAGLQQISVLKSELVFGTLTDYLSSRFYEDWDDVNLVPFETILGADMTIRVQWTGNRYLVISYGPLNLEQAYVYDSSLKQWGKLRIPHACIVDFIVKADGNRLSYSNEVNNSYSSLYSIAYDELTSVSQNPASVKRTMGILQNDGTVLVPVMDEYNFTANAVALIGYYRLIRQNLLAIQQISVENIDTQNYAFNLSVISSQLDSAIQTTTVFDSYSINVEGASSIRVLYGYSVGIDHSILLQGSFSIISLEFWFTLDGRR